MIFYQLILICNSEDSTIQMKYTLYFAAKHKRTIYIPEIFLIAIIMNTIQMKQFETRIKLTDIKKTKAHNKAKIYHIFGVIDTM